MEKTQKKKKKHLTSASLSVPHFRLLLQFGREGGLYVNLRGWSSLVESKSQYYDFFMR